MPQTPEVGDDVVILSKTNQFNGLHGEVVSLVGSTAVNGDLAVVALRPFGNKAGDVFNDTHNRQKFRYTELKVLTGSGGDAAVRKGSGAVDTDTSPITAGDTRYTPSPAERRDSAGSGYNGVEPQATLG